MRPGDRRVDCRIDLKLPCHVAAATGNSRLFVGVTENVSRRGLLVSWNTGGPRGELPKPGDALTLEIELPANHPFGPKCLHCRATVVRVTKTETSFPRVAFEINVMQFRSVAGRRSRAGASREYSGQLM